MVNSNTFAREWKLLLQKKYNLSDLQCSQLETYAFELQQWNKNMNLTALDTLEEIVDFHFFDSLALADGMDLLTINAFADVGTGAGFPALPLKIAFPHMKVVLIEVLHKRIAFLKHVVALLGLENITIVDYDWRTFLRKTEFDVDLIIARASLSPEELLRMFRPGCRYNNGVLVYWASDQWEPTENEKKFVTAQHQYVVGKKQRKLVFFRR
jgi:16S rRNA (guanine527-N7)-methyltransferase